MARIAAAGHSGGRLQTVLPDGHDSSQVAVAFVRPLASSTVL
jgi:hypothetical protein